MTIYDCRTHVRMTSMTSSIERTDLNFKISVALFMSISAVTITKCEILKLLGRYISMLNI